MSSRILNRGESRPVHAMVWARSAQAILNPDSGWRPPGENSQHAVSDDLTETRNRLAALQTRLEGETTAAYQRGLREGQAMERNTHAAEEQAAVERLTRAIAEIAQVRPRLRNEAESDVVQLALAIARRVLRREMSIDESAMHALVKVAIEKLERQEICRVYVHPDQAEAVQAGLKAQGVRGVEIISERSRAAGALIFETNRGKLDASVNAQLEEIERGLTDRMANS